MLQQIVDGGIHYLNQGCRPEAQQQHRRRQGAEHDILTLIHVLQCRHAFVGDIAEYHPLDHPQGVGGADDQGGGGEEGIPEIGPETGENHHELADKTGGARQARVGHGKEDHEGAEHRHGVDHATVILDLAAVQPVVEHADAEEECRRDKAMGDHLHHAALHTQGGAATGVVLADDEDDEKAQGDEAHVGNRRVGDQLLHVLLDQGHKTDVDHRDQRHADDQPVQGMAGVRRDRQAEAEEAVTADLQHDRRQDHRASGGRLHMGVGQPGVHRPHRHLHREGEEEGDEDQDLFGEVQLQGMVSEDVEAARLKVHVDQRDQHEDRAEEGIEEELDGGVDPVRSAPDTDDEKHRDQHRLPVDIEEHRVQGREDTHHHPLHDEKGGHVLRRTVLDHLPTGDNHQGSDKGGENDQRHGDAVHTHVVLHIEGGNPGHPLDELHRRGGAVEGEPERQTDDEGQDGDDQGGPLGCIGLTVAAGEHHETTDDRNPDR